MNRSLGFVAVLVLSAGCAQPTRAPEIPLYDGLGSLHRTVTTDSAEAQRYFDQGLAFLFAFNHDEAIRSFRQAGELDPECAMAWWGEAIANGPHINNPAMPPERSAAAWEALERARRHAGRANSVEQALIEAAGARYLAQPPEDRAALDQAYADAMAEVHRKFPEDGDVAALYAEALMDLHPWDLYTQDGEPKSWTPPIVALLDDTLARHPGHPLALHLYIHAVEASTDPGRADGAADRLRDLQPGLGHLVHMPSHIDVRRGRWEDAITANTKAIAADERYRALRPQQGFYRVYMAHNAHMLAYAAMMVGRSAEAIRTMDGFVAAMPEDWKREYAWVADGYLAMPLEVRIRFGRWDEILAAPDLPAEFPVARALRRYARGIAYASKNQPVEARAEQRAFLEARAAVPEDAVFGNNSALDLLAVADRLLEGEIAYREGKIDEGLQAMREGVTLEDALRYDEPPDWIHPVRHALGASLVQAGKHAEAEAVYRADLAKLPGNGWALYGLSRALRAQGNSAEADEADKQFEAAWAKADIPLRSSCFCQPGV